MSADQPSVVEGPGAPESAAAGRPPGSHLKWIALGAAVLVGIGAGLGAAFVHGQGKSASDQNLPSPPTRPDATWPAGARRAPDFRLVDQYGAPISLRSLRGRPVIVTFIDPLCRNLCPLEAKVLNDVVARMTPAERPAIVAVSVNPWGDTRANFRQDARKWRLVPEWRWAAGPYGQLAPVWKKYAIGVLVRRKVIAGVSVRQIVHTEAAYIVDRAGFQRALYLYPFRADDVARTVRQLARATS